MSARCSGPRFSCDSAMTGTPSSFASSLSARENSLTSCWRDSTRLPRRHELQVVDDDHLEPDPLLEPAALRADLDERHVRAVVDVQRRVVDATAHARRSSSSRASRAFPCAWLCSGTDASADSRRIAISLRPISSEKKIVGMSCLIAAERAKSSASVDFPSAGRAATMISWPGCRPLVSWSSCGEARGHAGHLRRRARARPRSRRRRRRRPSVSGT